MPAAPPPKERTAASSEPTFSFAPLEEIQVQELKASRFLLEATRSLPYRDAQGNVSLHLLRSSAAAVSEVLFSLRPRHRVQSS